MCAFECNSDLFDWNICKWTKNYVDESSVLTSHNEKSGQFFHSSFELKNSTSRQVINNSEQIELLNFLLQSAFSFESWMILQILNVAAFHYLKHICWKQSFQSSIKFGWINLKLFLIKLPVCWWATLLLNIKVLLRKLFLPVVCENNQLLDALNI